MNCRTIRQALRESRDESGLSAHSLLVTVVWLMAAFVSGLSLTSFNASSAEESETSQTKKPVKCQPWELQEPGGGVAGGAGAGAGGAGAGTGDAGAGGANDGSGGSGAGTGYAAGSGGVEAGGGSGCLAACHSVLRKLEANVLQSVNDLESNPEAEPGPDAVGRTRLDWQFDWLSEPQSEPLSEPPSHEPLPEEIPDEPAAASAQEAPLSNVAVKVADQQDGCVIYNTATDEVYFDSRQTQPLS